MMSTHDHNEKQHIRMRWEAKEEEEEVVVEFCGRIRCAGDAVYLAQVRNIAMFSGTLNIAYACKSNENVFVP